MFNKYHCCEKDCAYQTTGSTENEAEKQLIQDGGYDQNKQTMCPRCKNDSLVFIPNMKESYRGSSEYNPTIENWTVFFTYGENHAYKSMAMVKATSMKEAGDKVKEAINLEEYPNFHIWWTEKLENMYDGQNVIIP